MVDASILPSIPSSNLDAVVMMVAEKLSDAVLEKPPLTPIEPGAAAP